MQKTVEHSAEAAALGFYFQTFFALLTLLSQRTDNAAVSVEQLDDVSLKVDGQTLLYQLKHSISIAPPPVTLASRAFWRTIKVWIDAVPELSLSETTFYLITVADIGVGSQLKCLNEPETDRADLAHAMEAEAQRVMDARAVAAKAGKPLPHSDRADGCEAFLALTDTERLNLLRRIRLDDGTPSIGAIEDRISNELKTLVPVELRSEVAMRLVQWWDREIVYSLCGKRNRVISKVELQRQICEIIGDIEQDRLVPDFEMVNPPEDYQPDGILTHQIRLVQGLPSDISKAIREEWRAREQRSKWLVGNPGMATLIGNYDILLVEYWSDHHCQMVEQCVGLEDGKKCALGLEVLRWTHETAPGIVRPLAQGWSAAYYVRGSYQVLAINKDVGWHPHYSALLKDEE